MGVVPTYSVLTLFPEWILEHCKYSILKRGIDAGLFAIVPYNLRDFSTDKHGHVDDVPYGGGGGMLLTCQPLFSAIEHILSLHESTYVVFLSPSGKRFTQANCERLVRQHPHILFICGHYEGIDQRVIDTFVDEEISLGDFVLTGGELATMCVIDALIRHIPGVLGNEESVKQESFSKTLQRKKEYPHYTRPPEFRGMKVPDILLSGHHQRIEEWRRNNLR